MPYALGNQSLNVLGTLWTAETIKLKLKSPELGIMGLLGIPRIRAPAFEFLFLDYTPRLKLDARLCTSVGQCNVYPEKGAGATVGIS